MSFRLFAIIFFVSVYGKLKCQAAPDTITYSFELDSLHRAEFEDFEKQFSHWFHNSYCKKMKIKISCAGCSRFYQHVVFAITNGGKIEIREARPGKFCGKELTEKQRKEFLKGFNNFVFTGFFSGKIVRFNFNRTLKC